jgi:uncharacterized membrane protein
VGTPDFLAKLITCSDQIAAANQWFPNTSRTTNSSCEEARLSSGLFYLLLLLALGVSLLAVLAGILGVLLGARGVLFALGVVVLAVVLGCRAMRFGGILVVLSRLVVFVLGH